MASRQRLLVLSVVGLGLLLVVLLPRLGGGGTHEFEEPRNHALATPPDARTGTKSPPSGGRAIAPSESAPPTEANNSLLCGPAPAGCTASNRAACCYGRGRFLFFGNSFGRHHNQMSSLAAAVALAIRLDRTLVVPPFKDGRQSHIISDLYDASGLLDPAQSGVCMMHAGEFTAKETKVNATCVTMRGIAELPQRVPHFDITCGAKAFIKYKKRLSLFMATAKGDAAVHATRFLTIPLAIYYAQALPLVEVTCPWRHIRPHSRVQVALGKFEECTDTRVGTDLLGVHLRSLEGSCGSRVNNFVHSSNAAKREAVKAQCEMTAAQLKKVVAGAFGGKALVIVADDNQQPEKAEKLAADLGGLRLRAVGKRCPLAVGELSSGGTAVGGAFWGMNFDFWLLAGSRQFHGNQLSTLSMNVCRKRLSEGKKCENFFEFEVPDPETK